MKRYYITDRKPLGGFHSLLEVIREQLHLGVNFIQIREKDVSGRELFEFARAVVGLRHQELPERCATKILLNSRADIALASGCEGVHLPSRAPNEILPGLLIARSCHTFEEIRASNADFVTFGPVFASPGKGQPTGVEALRTACSFGKPVFALGGVTWGNAAECIKAGATGIAGIRLFQNPE